MTEGQSAPERYFDHHSSSPLSPEARRASSEALDAFGDPLHLHERGRAARRALDEAREEMASSIGAQPDEIVFTSGGAESVALALLGVGEGVPQGRVVVSAVEHPAVLRSAGTLAGRGLEVVHVPVDRDGRIDVDRFAIEVRRPGTVLASVQHANHEVGTMQPVAEAALLAREAGVAFHTDARPTVGRLPVDVGALGVDLLSLSARAFGGPPGSGALYARRGVRLHPIIPGDDRERRRRSGLQGLPGILGMAAGLRASLRDLADRAAAHWALTTGLRRALESSVSGLRLHGHPTQRTPYLVCFSLADVDAEVLIMALDQRGFRVDAGSVTTGSPHEPSPVLAAMGCPDTVGIRASVGPGTAESDVEALVEALGELVDALARMRT